MNHSHMQYSTRRRSSTESKYSEADSQQLNDLLHQIIHSDNDDDENGNGDDDKIVVNEMDDVDKIFQGDIRTMIVNDNDKLPVEKYLSQTKENKGDKPSFFNGLYKRVKNLFVYKETPTIDNHEKLKRPIIKPPELQFKNITILGRDRNEGGIRKPGIPNQRNKKKELNEKLKEFIKKGKEKNKINLLETILKDTEVVNVSDNEEQVVEERDKVEGLEEEIKELIQKEKEERANDSKGLDEEINKLLNKEKEIEVGDSSEKGEIINEDANGYTNGNIINNNTVENDTVENDIANNEIVGNITVDNHRVDSDIVDYDIPDNDIHTDSMSTDEIISDDILSDKADNHIDNIDKVNKEIVSNIYDKESDSEVIEQPATTQESTQESIVEDDSLLEIRPIEQPQVHKTKSIQEILNEKTHVKKPDPIIEKPIIKKQPKIIETIPAEKVDDIKKNSYFDAIKSITRKDSLKKVKKRNNKRKIVYSRNESESESEDGYYDGDDDDNNYVNDKEDHTDKLDNASDLHSQFWKDDKRREKSVLFKVDDKKNRKYTSELIDVNKGIELHSGGLFEEEEDVLQKKKADVEKPIEKSIKKSKNGETKEKLKKKLKDKHKTKITDLSVDTPVDQKDKADKPESISEGLFVSEDYGDSKDASADATDEEIEEIGSARIVRKPKKLKINKNYYGKVKFVEEEKGKKNLKNLKKKGKKRKRRERNLNNNEVIEIVCLSD